MKTKIHITILSLALLATSCGRTPQTAESRMYVETTRAETVEINPVQEFPFIAKPLRTSVLSFRVSGPVDRFDVYVGNRYRCGELIAEIDPRDFQLRYEQAEASYRQVQSDYERVASLYEKGNLPASSYEEARAAGVAARTARDAAMNALNDTQLLAPFDGYVGEVFIERYQDVKASQPVVTLADISSLRIEIYVTQQVAMKAASLDEVELELDNLPGRTFRAKVVDCARSTTPNNLSYLLTAMLPNPDGEFPAGVSGRVRFALPGDADRIVAVPRSALCHRPGDGDFVWTVDPSSGCAVQRPIEVGRLLQGDMIAVESGISAGETVIVSGMRLLYDGKPVGTAEPDTACNTESHIP